jgi:hypothetical protein
VTATRKLFLLPLALVCATCAPVGERAESTAPALELPPPEPLTIAPRETKDPTRMRIESAVENVRNRELLTTTGFWTVFHGILGLGPDITLRDPDTGKRHNAVDFIAGGNELRGLGIIPTKHGLDVEWGRTIGVSQGHQDQFVCELGQWGMPADRKFVVFGKEYTFLDFVNHAQMRASTTKNQELSWAVPLLAQYKGVDMPAWDNAFGERLTLQDMIRYELDAPVETAACGGTHRLFGLTWAYHHHLQKGGATAGVWKDVADKTAKYRDLAKRYQNADGSFSTSYFRGPGDSPDKGARIGTTGHILEWLALALSDDEVKQEWVQRAANALALLILDLQDQPIDGGALYHAVHGLQMYHARVYGRTSFVPQQLLIPLPPKPGDTAAASQ